MDLGELSDEALLRRVGEGERPALRELYDRHAAWLSLRLLRRCGDRELTEEVLQDTFVVVWRTARAYHGGGEVAAWLWGIGVRRLLDRLRRVRRAFRAPVESGLEPSAEDQVLAGIEFGDLAGALHRLSPELRAVLQATVLDGLTAREAAGLLGIPVGTVKTRLMRARAELRRVLQ